jgi:ribosomal protection tetracycline resistance protein
MDGIGGVDDGSTRTDTFALERRCGNTIRPAIVPLVLNDGTVYLIDTPGRDFIAEGERVLSVLDGAVQSARCRSESNADRRSL